MTRILLYEPSFRRIEMRLPKTVDRNEVLLMADDGVVRRGDDPVPPESARPHVGWVNTDLFRSAALRPYVITLLKSPDLRWVQSGAAGFDHPAFKQFVAKGARMTNSHAQAVGISEYVLAEVLNHFQRRPERSADQAAKRWKEIPYREVAGSHWLIIGFGAIGQEVARRVRPFGVRVTAARRSVTRENPIIAALRGLVGAAPSLADAVVPSDAVHTVLPAADVVVLAAPLNAQTADLVDEAFLGRMKPGSMLVNVGRGGLVNEPALLAALERGIPEHAVLDVFATEPLPLESPFWAHPRVTLTPHASAAGSGLTGRGDDLFVDNLGRYLSGKPLVNEVDPKEVMGG